MYHIGNDIVDLQQAYATQKTRDERFLKRVFSETEQELILSHQNPEFCLWLLWAAKEAGYKAISKPTQVPIFSPIEFQVTVKKNTIILNYKNQILAFNFCFTDEYLHVYSKSIHYLSVNKLDEHSNKIFQKRKNLNVFSQSEQKLIQSEAQAVIRYDLKKFIERKFKISYEEIEILRYSFNKKMAPAYVKVSNQPEKFKISLSHHGQFYAWVLFIL